MKMRQCKPCMGTGMDNVGICPLCKGKGYILEK